MGVQVRPGPSGSVLCPVPQGRCAELRGQLLIEPPPSAPQQSRVEEESLRQLFKILEQHMSGVRKLQEVLTRDQRDMEILARGASS